MNSNNGKPVSLIWLVDGRHEVRDVTAQKVVSLAKTYQADISVIYDKRLRASERSYWLSLQKFQAISNEWLEKQANRNQFIKETLEHAGVEYIFNSIETPDYIHQLQTAINDAENPVVILQDEKLMLRHPVFQELTQLNCNIFLLGEKPWAKDMSLLGAVDPLHENARPKDLDDKILATTKRLAQHFAADWRIAHVSYVPPSFLQYKAKIVQIHREGLNRFCADNGVTEKRRLLLQGMPENAIEQWCKKQHSDLLVIGYVARNKLMSHLIGSTTVALLSDPPCDMLLMRGSI